MHYAGTHVVILRLQLGPHATFIREHIQQRLVTIATDRGIHRGDLLVELEHTIYVVYRAIQCKGDVLCSRFMIETMGEFTSSTQINVQLFDHMDRQADGAGLVHDGPLYGLADPPSGIGGKTKAAFRVEFLYRADEAKVALFDEIQQHQAAVVVATGDLDHQSQVGLNHALAGGFVASQRTTSVIDFFFGGEQGGEANLPQIELGSIHHLVDFRSHQFIGNSLFNFSGYFLNLFLLTGLQLFVEL